MGYNENYGTVASTKLVEPFNPKIEEFETSYIQEIFKRLNEVRGKSGSLKKLAKDKEESDEDDNYGSLLFEPDQDEIEDDNYGSIMFDDDY